MLYDCERKILLRNLPTDVSLSACRNTTVSDIKDEDFTKAAKEKIMTDNNINKQIDAKSILLWSGLIALVLCGLGLFYEGRKMRR